ncbi:hypothetical protein BDN72DRAFT_825147, partial [Pluteus cervinus]
MVFPLSHPVLTQHFDSPDVAFTKIGQEIAILQEGIRALYAFRNTFTPVYRLPPEVLSWIFTLVQQMADNEIPKSSLHRMDLGRRLPSWVIVTHVSQHWRNVGIGCASLWSSISSPYPEWIKEEWSRRSKASPLDLNLARISQQDVQLVRNSIFRIRKLTVVADFHMGNTLISHLYSPAPLLEVLYVSIRDPWQ